MLYFTDDNSPTSYDLTTVMYGRSLLAIAVLHSAKYVSFPDFSHFYRRFSARNITFWYLFLAYFRPG
jgi:hypothetical protein